MAAPLVQSLSHLKLLPLVPLQFLWIPQQIQPQIQPQVQPQIQPQSAITANNPSLKKDSSYTWLTVSETIYFVHSVTKPCPKRSSNQRLLTNTVLNVDILQQASKNEQNTKISDIPRWPVTFAKMRLCSLVWLSWLPTNNKIAQEE